ncbi:Carboxypeptidase regulatory-like domain-containing protein [Candidatus Electrothrix aarhusensis]|uniref:Carboxypeptidase regulatory-like domain-containing protein n=1 Tax=Candidatus Electrothrix aarhusensis TaxID=1859131 RepID=A0A444IV20_9BACT|nr:Carboxypeptidase regulatory-like domain-containing protein [Candidatus Electrothrix aarhusensis]
MIFLMNKTQLQNNTRTARGSLLPLIVCCFMAISNNAFAQYPNSSPYSSVQYQTDTEMTDNGGGTWGEILNMNARIEESVVTFSITSKKGPFYNTNSISIRSGSHTGPIVATGKIPPGSEAAQLQLDLIAVVTFPQLFFATITNNIGYAWVGPIQISKNETTASEPPVSWDDPQPNNGPQRPLISESPETTAINTTVTLAVTAGQTHSNDMVKVQCTASDSDNTPNTPYRSGWIYSGDTINVPLTFHSAGTQAIFCNTLDSEGTTSSLSQRTITVTPGRRTSTFEVPRRELSDTPPPPPPAPRRDLSGPPSGPVPVPARRRITSTPPPLVKIANHGSVNVPITIKLTAGNDPQNRDLVRIGCTADNSNRTPADPYLSDWLPPEAKAKGTITFYSPGEKNIYCTSLSRQEVASPPTKKTINIQVANRAPSKPEISSYPDATTVEKTTYISVTAGSDPDGDMVKVRCSAADSNMTGDAPYISDWVTPQSTVTAAPVFYTSGNKKITCVTIDRKDAKSDKVTRKLHVHSSQYNSGYSSDHNFNNTSNTSSAESCGCQQNDTPSSSVPMKSNMRQEEITFNQPYIPEYSTPNYSTPKYSTPDYSTPKYSTPDYSTPKYSTPEYPTRQSVFQAPAPQPDLKGRVVYRSNGSPAQNAMIKLWDAMSGRAYTATTDYNGEFTLNFIQKNLTGQIQATQGADTSAIREVQIKADKPTVVDLIIMDRASAQSTQPQQWSSQPQWPTTQTAPAQPQQQQQMQQQWSPQSQWPAKQAAPAHNSVWQFN